MTQTILIVDDQEDICTLIAGVLEDEGYKTLSVHDAHGAIQAVAAAPPDMIILDIWLEGSDMDGIDLLKKLVKSHPEIPVIMISGHGNIETAVSAIQIGAYDFIEKPFKSEKLLVMTQRALEAGRLRRENRELRLRAARTPAELHGASKLIQSVRHDISCVAPTGSRVLITGAPGTGKDIAARLIHNQSKRAQANYVALNCAILSPERLEQELFGAGGAFERAGGGTLFLDEVVDLPPETQAKIVRVFQDNNFIRTGGRERVDVDVRVIAATNQDLAERMEQGRFRQDLYYRLSVVPIRMPSLQERAEDIPTLAGHFMEQAALAAGAAPRPFAEDAMALMQSYEWPGNVRQLRNVIEWLLIMAPGEGEGAITAAMLPPELQQKAAEIVHGQGVVELMSKPLREAREIFEREYILSQMNRFGGNISRTAGFIGMERSALHRKLKSLGIQTPDKEAAEG